MGTSRRAQGALALVIAVSASSAGCFGYTRSAKRWAYAGDAVLVVGGAAAVSADLLSGDDAPPAMPGVAEPYQAPVSGMLAVGVIVATAGVIGMIINATRPELKTSR